MIKIYCNKCKKETIGAEIKRVVEEQYACDTEGNKILRFPRAAYDVCEKCLEKYEKLDVEIGDFMQMSDEEIELEYYTFKAGDQIITDDGRVGTITDICTCERCKGRGFYEPSVILENGDRIWITDTDKENGFISFYKIGNKVFGNIDEEAIDRIKEEIKSLKLEIDSLEGQLDMLKKLKEDKENE